MTERPRLQRSLYVERASTVEGKLGLAAASAAASIVRLLRAAKAASGLASREIAAKLGITEGRASQVLNSDGNLHIATAARFLRAMGYELSLSAIPVEPGREPLNLNVRRSRSGRSNKPEDRTYEIYSQIFLTHDGPMEIPMLVPGDETLQTAPHGQPSMIARVNVTREGRVRHVPLRRDGWQARALEVNRVGA